IIIAAIFISFKLALRNVVFREKYHRFLLSIPVINKTIIAVNSARFLRTFGILFTAGVPVIDAMTSANSIINLIPIHKAIAIATTQVGEGKTIYASLQKTGYFSSLSNQLIASGESSGQLEAMLEKAASFQEQQTAQKLSTALALFEPILILSMGLIVLFIVLAVLIPIFDMNNLIQYKLQRTFMSKPLYQNKIYVKKSKTHGYGVFAGKNIKKGEVIEQCYIIISRRGFDKALEDYYFDVNGKYGVFFGYGCIYNHSDDQNADYRFATKRKVATFKANRSIKKDEEILIS